MRESILTSSSDFTSSSTTKHLSFDDWGIKIEKARADYYAADKGSEEEGVALARWYNYAFRQVEAALVVSQASTAHEAAPRGTTIEEMAAKKWDELTISNIETSNLVPELEMIVKMARPGSAAKKFAEKKLKLLISFQK